MNTLSNVKLSKKKMLEELQARLLLFQHKMTQQEILDKIVEYAQQHFDEFLQEQFPEKRLTLEKVEKIKKLIYSGEIETPDVSNDELLYGENAP